MSAGRAMLATYEGLNLDVALPILSIAVLLISLAMLRTRLFSRLTAAIGILSVAMQFAYYPTIALPIEGIFMSRLQGLSS